MKALGVFLFTVFLTASGFACDVNPGILNFIGIPEMSMFVCGKPGAKYHPNGAYAGSPGGAWYYSSGAYAGSAGGAWYHKSGGYAGSVGGAWYHQSGGYAGSEGGAWYYPSGGYAGSLF